MKKIYSFIVGFMVAFVLTWFMLSAIAEYKSVRTGLDQDISIMQSMENQSRWEKANEVKYGK